MNDLYYRDEYIRESFSMRMMRKLLKSALRHKGPFFGSLLIEVGLGLFALLPGILYSVIIGALFPAEGGLQEDFLLITLLACGGLAVAWAGSVIFGHMENLIPVKYGMLFATELRKEIMDHVMELSFSYFDTHSTGKILVRVTSYVDDIAELFGNLFYSIVYAAGVLVIGVIWILCLDWRIGGAVVLALIPLGILMYILSVLIHRRAGMDHNKNANYTAFVAENIGGAEVVRAYDRAPLNCEIGAQLFGEYKHAFMRTTNVREAFFPLAHGFTNAIVILIVYGVALSIGLGGGALALEPVIAIGTVLSEVTSSIGNICTNLTTVFTLTSDLERIYDTIETPVEVCDGEDAEPLGECAGNVRFDDVTFSYTEGISVLEHFTLEAKAGETVALVGATGSGKTTVVSLLSRFYDVRDGAVLLDGRDIKKYTLHSLREGVGAMMQDTYIFSGTVLENIRFSRPDATDEECKAAARAACCEGFISRLPGGYDTFVSEDGPLSGGERQLLSFARLILADPRVIVLDEATSHVDTQTELEVQRSLKNLMAGRTSFVIAHRLSTIRGADKIVFLKNGRIAEQGTHEELLALGGEYAKLVKTL